MAGDNFDDNGMSYEVLTDGTKGTDYTVKLTGVAVNGGKVTIDKTVEKNGQIYTVMGIAATAFQNVSDITNISVPVSLCSDLNTALPQGPFSKERYSIEITGEGAVSGFAYNTNITSVSFGEGITTINPGAFLGCDHLTTIEKWGGVTSIGASAFERCCLSEELTIPAQITEIGDRAFVDWGAIVVFKLTVNLPSTLQGEINAEAVFAPNNSAKQTLAIKYYEVTDTQG